MPYFANKHVYDDSKVILIENEKITTNTNIVLKRRLY